MDNGVLPESDLYLFDVDRRAFGLLIPRSRTFAAFLMEVMILIWILFLHIPRFVYNPYDASDWLGLCESITLVGMLWVLAGTNSKRATCLKILQLLMALIRFY